MPHAVDQFEQQDLADEAEILRLLNPGDNPSSGPLIDFDRDLEVGEKADDAEDFEDIGDDDLADDEDEITATAAAATHHGNGINAHHTNGAHGTGAAEGFDDEPDFPFGEDLGEDLFGDDDTGLFEDDVDKTVTSQPEPAIPGGLALPSKNRISLPGTIPSKSFTADSETYGSPASLANSEDLDAKLAQSDEDMEEDDGDDDDDEDEDVLLQRRLFAEMEKEREERTRRGSSYEPPQAGEADLETLYNLWPMYDPEERPRFIELFPQRKGVYPWKAPQKPPKPVQPTKLSLELASDQEKSFRLPGAATVSHTSTESQGIILIKNARKREEDSDDDVDEDEVDEQEMVGGVSWQDLTVICEDWDLPSVVSVDGDLPDSGIDMSKDSESDNDLHSQKKRKRRMSDTAFDLTTAMAFSQTLPSLEDPERATAKIAKRVQLNMNDPGLLLDDNVPTTQPRKIRRLAGDMGREAKSAAARDMTRRYNISNDEAYELLKENHQHKVRSTLGSMAVEHSLPATKLQFPFYRVSLSEKEKRSFHRPMFSGMRPTITYPISKPKKLKRKELRGKDPTVVFAKAEDLSMADNSSALLLEYSEEHPVMLSNFGMGNRLINYYRRKDDTDTSRPKEELGETQVLLPQDRSPFANFGQVDPGEMVPTIHNGLYRAPIFKHEARNTDFLVITTENSGGVKWYMRNVENLHAVGQQFPSVEVPGEHSRKVTEAAKKRLRAISYRVVKKYAEKRGPALTNEVVKSHLPGSDIGQNRGKMREFMQYNKDNSNWQLKPGDQVPDAETLRGWIKPEEICLLDSMQVGVQRLKDLGLKVEKDDDGGKEGDHIETLLAPWNTTKNFLNACQGKAMLQLHGEGDPTARGEGFSFIKTSMKGGFRALGESVEERLDAKKLKENGGHSYNVAKQQAAYDESIRRIWRAQHESLSSRMEHSDVEDDYMDDDPDVSSRPAETPRSTAAPTKYGRRDDETMSQYSKFSTNQENTVEKSLVITREVINEEGQVVTVSEKVENPKIIEAYMKRKEKDALAKMEIE